MTKNRVAVAEPLLPEEVKRQGVKVDKQSTAMVEVVSLRSPGGTYDELYLSNYIATRIKDQLARVKGVGTVTVFGAKDFSMRIWLDPQQLKAREVTADQVMAAVREQNVSVAAGKIGAPPNPGDLPFQYNIITKGRLTTETGIREHRDQGRGRAATCSTCGMWPGSNWRSKDYSWYAEHSGSPAIALGIYQLPGSNALGVAEGVADIMDELAEDFPEDLEYEILYDATEYITASIDEVVETLIVAIILVIFVVWVFLQDWRTTLIPAITIPVSLIGTFAVLLGSGHVDQQPDAVRDHPGDRHRGGRCHPGHREHRAPDDRKGLGFPPGHHRGHGGSHRSGDRLDRRAAGRVRAHPDDARADRPSLPPVRHHHFHRHHLLLDQRPDPEPGPVPAPAQAGGSGQEEVDLLPQVRRVLREEHQRLQGSGGGLLRKSGLSMLIFAGLMVLTVWASSRCPMGFLPDEDQGYFFINAQLPDGSSLDRTKEVTDKINAILSNTEGVAKFLTVGGYSLLDAVQSPNAAMYIVTMDNWSDRGDAELHIFKVMERLQKQFFGIQEAIVFGFLPPPIMGLGNAGGFAFELQDRGGAGIMQLQQAALDMVGAANASPKLTRMNQNLRATVPMLYLNIDRVKAQSYNLQHERGVRDPVHLSGISPT